MNETTMKISQTVYISLAIALIGAILGLTVGSYLIGFWTASMMTIIIHGLSKYVSKTSASIMIGAMAGFTIGIIWSPQGYLSGVTTIAGGITAYVLYKRSVKQVADR